MIPITGGFEHWRGAVRAGQVLCPACGEPLSPRGFAAPLAAVRGAPDHIEGLGPGGERIRAWCRRCRTGHTLLPAVLVSRRADTAQALGEAVTAHARHGQGACQIAARLGVPRRTVTGWLAQARSYAARHAARLTGLAAALAAVELLPLVPSGDPVRELLTLLAAVTGAAAARWGTLGAGYWERVNLICGARFLSGSRQVPDYLEPATALPA
jgi:hypothetical protein